MSNQIYKVVRLILLIVIAYTSPALAKMSAPNNNNTLTLTQTYEGQELNWEEHTIVESVEMFNEFYDSASESEQQVINEQLATAANHIDNKYKEPSFWEKRKSGFYCEDFRGGIMLTVALSSLGGPLFIPAVIVGAVLYAPAFVADKVMGCGDPLDRVFSL